MVADQVMWLTDADCHRPELAGGKGASLGRMTSDGFPVPPGFVIGAGALESSLRAHGSLEAARALLADVGRSTSLDAARQLHDLVVSSPPGYDLADQIAAAYEKLGESPAVAVRSSACAEDGEAASYAGQQETFLNVVGLDDLLQKVAECWASFFAERAVFYRRLKGSLDDMAIAVVVQRLLIAEKAGVLFTMDPVRRRRDQMVIEAAFGLGEALVSGLVTPDNYLALRDGTLKKVRVSRQDREIVRNPAGGTIERALTEERATSQVLDEGEVAKLVEMAVKLEGVFGGPQDVEWAIEDGELYLLQSRPITA